MLQVARVAPKALGESAALVREFFGRQFAWVYRPIYKIDTRIRTQYWRIQLLNDGSAVYPYLGSQPLDGYDGEMH